MPWKKEWVDPEVFMIHNGVTIYKTYEDKDWYDVNEWYFTTSSDENESQYEFDVTQLPGFEPKETWWNAEMGDIIHAIQDAIDKELIKAPCMTD